MVLLAGVCVGACARHALPQLEEPTAVRQLSLGCGPYPGTVLAVGDAVQLRAAWLDLFGDLGHCGGDTVSARWSSSAPDVAPLSATGVIVGANPGYSEVTATSGRHAAQRTFRVVPRISDVRWSISSDHVVVGDTVRIRAIVLDSARRPAATLAPTFRQSHESDGYRFGYVAWSDSAGFIGVAEIAGRETFGLVVGTWRDSVTVAVHPRRHAGRGPPARDCPSSARVR